MSTDAKKADDKVEDKEEKETTSPPESTNDDSGSTEPSGKDDSGNDSDSLGEAGQKALREERKGRKAAETRLAELQERIATLESEKDEEIARLNAIIDEKNRAAELAELRTLRSTKIADAGLPPEAVDFITATDEKEIDAQIERLAELAGDRLHKRLGYASALGQQGKTGGTAAHTAFGDLMRQALNRN